VEDNPSLLSPDWVDQPEDPRGGDEGNCEPVVGFLFFFLFHATDGDTPLQSVLWPCRETFFFLCSRLAQETKIAKDEINPEGRPFLSAHNFVLKKKKNMGCRVSFWLMNAFFFFFFFFAKQFSSLCSCRGQKEQEAWRGKLIFFFVVRGI
jgi:hypothetical protein